LRTPKVLVLSLALILVLGLATALSALAGDNDAPPPPAPAKPGAVISGSAEAITLFIDEVPLRDVVGAIAKIADLNILVPQDVDGLITVRFRDIEPRRALEALARMTGNLLVEEPYGILRFVHPQDSTAPAPDLPTLEFQLRFYDVRDLLVGWPTLIADLREAFPKARFETRNDALVVTAPPGVHADVEAWLRGVRLRLATRRAGVGRPGRAEGPFAVPPKPQAPPPPAFGLAGPERDAPRAPSALQTELRRLTEEVRLLRQEVQELRRALEARPPTPKRRPPQPVPVEVDR